MTLFNVGLSSTPWNIQSLVGLTTVYTLGTDWTLWYSGI